ncbi:MAG TPA: hypothetical protein VGX68_18095 [Thermoanaerobaculia bacterium]|jgi:hypothetical protein|nr:hypothetical protein [Thermoanaerobaculia bacterium]
MTLPAARRWLAAVLLAAVLTPEAVFLEAAGHRCACGMTVGCCCLRKAAMKAGSHCLLHRPARSCSLRPGGDQKAEIRSPKLRTEWSGIALRDGLRLHLALADSPAARDDSPPDFPPPAPPTPPPRSFRVS